ncbi:hypothetical protein B0A58_02495, partial [Flavobacterium branchiophilum NBRC 15030 = ATCC 35035]
ENIGKTNVYIEGNLTDAECAAKLKAEVGSITENIYIGSLQEGTTSPNINSIELDIPTNIKLIQFNGKYDNLKTIKIKGHGVMPYCSISLFGGKNTESILVEGITELNSITCGFTAVEKINSIIEIKDLVAVRQSLSCSGNWGFDALNYNHTFICNSLKDVNKNNYFDLSHTGIGFGGHIASISINSLEFLNNAGLRIESYSAQITIPNLKQAIGITCATNTSYAPVNPIVFNFPLLSSVDTFNCIGYIGTINLPILTNCNTIYINKHYLMPNSINFNAPLLNSCKSYTSKNGLTSNGVNSILNKFLNIQPINGKLIDLTQEVAPTGQGIIDKQSLINQGNQVWTN